MFGHGRPDEAIALTLLVMGAPDLAQLVYHLHSTHFLLAHRTMVTLAATARSLTDARPAFLVVFRILIHHLVRFLSLYYTEGLRSAAVSQSFLDQGGVKSLCLQGVLDILDIFEFGVCGLVFFKGVFFPEDVFLSSDFFEGFLHVLFDQWFFLL
jgi:hypothetical protein